MQLFLYQRDRVSGVTTCVNNGAALTMAEGVVESIAGMSIKRNILYFFSTDNNAIGPPSSDLFAVPIFQNKSDGTANCQVQITHTNGYHLGTMNRALTYFVDVSSSISAPPTTTLYKLPEEFM